MRIRDIIVEGWSEKYKSSINCNNPKGFSQKAHCAGRKKNEDAQPSQIRIYMSHDPGWMGAFFVNDYKGDELKPTTLPASIIKGFEPDSKMKDPKSAANVKKIIAGIEKGDNIPPILVRKMASGYQVIDGHHRFWAQKKIGQKNIAVKIVPPSLIKDVKGKSEIPHNVDEEAAGVGIVTKQNATADVPVGGEYMNVKKLFPSKKRKSKKK